MTRRFIVFALSCLLLFLCPIGVAEAQTAPPTCSIAAGAFPIYDGTCKNYYICVNDGERLVPVTLSCSATTIFDPALQRCVTGAVCWQTTTPVTCSELGIFEIYDGTCQNYYLCVKDGETLVAVILSCAPTAIFDPLQNTCVIGGICRQTTPTPTTTLAPPITAAPCVRYGRFRILDVACKRYYLCYWDGVRYVIMDNLICPNTLLFDPVSEKCVPPERYTCLGIAQG